MAYAFGGPILFQYTNVIYLIGAAWLPLGMHAVDRWVRLGRRWGLVELAIVLSMQSPRRRPAGRLPAGRGEYRLRGGPGLEPCAIEEARPCRGRYRAARRSASSVPLAIVALVLWCLVTLVLARWLPKLRVIRGIRLRRSAGRPGCPAGVIVAWGLVAIGFLLHWRLRVWRHPLGAMWLGLAGAAALSAALTAAQLLPVIEFTQRTGRSHRERGRGLRVQRAAGPAGRAGLAQCPRHAVSNE